MKTGMKARKIEDPRLDRLLWFTGLGVLALTLAALLIFLGLRNRRSGGEEGFTGMGTITLVFSCPWERVIESGVLETLAREFEKQEGNIRIQLETGSYAGQADVLGLDPRHQTAETVEEAQALVSFMDLFFYNIDILQAAGFDRPPKTRTEVLDMARAATEAGYRGLDLRLSPQDPLALDRDIFPWIWASGARLAEGGELRFDSAPVRTILRFLAELYQDGLAGTDALERRGEDGLRDFMAGKTAMMTGSIRDIAAVEAAEGLSFGIAALPGPAEMTGKPLIGLSVWSAGISPGTAHPEEARRFLGFLVENRGRIAGASGGGPAGQNPGAIPETFAAESLRGNSLYVKAWDIWEAGEPAVDLAGLENLGPLDTIIREELNRMLSGDQSPENTARTVQRRWEEYP
ncbi:MAG: extracellular solute-binding protein [Treponema sp.]|nr:extracellular solute-binding protein [Treponema sp.]